MATQEELLQALINSNKYADGNIMPTPNPDRISIADYLQEDASGMADAVTQAGSQYFASKPYFTQYNEPNINNNAFADGNYIPTGGDQPSIQKDIGNMLYQGGKKVVTDPIGVAKDIYQGFKDPIVKTYEGIETAIPEYYKGKINEGNRAIANSVWGGLETTANLADMIPFIPPVFGATKKIVGKASSELVDAVADANKITDVAPDGSFSPTSRMVQTLQDKGTGQQYYNQLAKGDGKGSKIVEEMKDTGLGNWLQKQDKVTKQEILDYMRVHKRQLDEVTYSTSPEISPVYEPKFKNQYQLKGGSNYRENVTQQIDNPNVDYDVHIQQMQTRYRERIRNELEPMAGTVEDWLLDDILENNFNGNDEYNLGQIISPREKAQLDILKDRKKQVQPTFDNVPAREGGLGMEPSPAHRFPEKNIAFFTRTKTHSLADGSQMHLMEELQSDWQAKYKNTLKLITQRKKDFTRLDELNVKSNNYFEMDNPNGLISDLASDVKMGLQNAQKQAFDDLNWKIKLYDELPPDMPSYMDAEMYMDIIAQQVDDGDKITEGLYVGLNKKDITFNNNADVENYVQELEKRRDEGEIDDLFYENVMDDITDYYIQDEELKTAFLINARATSSKSYEGARSSDFRTDFSDDEFKELLSLNEKLGSTGLAEIRHNTNIKNMPTEPKSAKSWMTQGIKKEIKRAIDEGQDYFGWSGGDIQNARYGSDGKELKNLYDKDYLTRTKKIIEDMDKDATIVKVQLENGERVWGVKITDKMRGGKRFGNKPIEWSMYGVGGAAVANELMNEKEQNYRGQLQTY